MSNNETNETNGSVISAVDALEEAVRRMNVNKECYENKSLATGQTVFLNYASVVKEDIDIIKDLEREYGLLGDDPKEVNLEMDR